MPSSKRQQDYSAAILRRIQTMADIQARVPEFGYELIEPIDKEKGIVFKCEWNEMENRRLIKLLYKEHGLYDKLSKRYIDKPIRYLQWMQELGMVVLVVEDGKFSQPIDYKYILENWKFVMNKSKGNKNRMTYLGRASQIVCSDLTQSNIFGISIKDELKRLFQ